MRVVIAIAAAALLSACGSGEMSQQAGTQTENQSVAQPSQAPAGPETMEFTPPNEGKLSDEHMKMYISVKIKEKMLKQTQEGSDVNVTENAETETDTAKADTQPVNGAEEKTVAEGSAESASSPQVATADAPVEIANTENVTAADTTVQTTDAEKLSVEKLAINEFGYDMKLYQWISQTVTEVMARHSIKSQALQSIEKPKADGSKDSSMEVASANDEVTMHNDAMVMKYAQELAFAHNDELSDSDGAPNSASTAENVAKQPAEPAVTTQPAGS